MNLVLVGGSGGTNIADSLLSSAQQLSICSVLINTQPAYQAANWLKKFNWYCRGRHPSQLKSFSRTLFEKCLDLQPEWLITTGVAPVDQRTLSALGEIGIKRINFLTDDPWNKAHYARWFLYGLSHYDLVFSPRRANIEDLLKAGCRQVEYLPFGYDPKLFYTESPRPREETPEKSDIIFAGGADRDRIPYISTLIKAGFNVNLYGSYWERYPETRAYTKGQADVPTLRRAIQNAKIALCIVRHANRDGHCMRTFEVPAMGTCMLTEDTPEHREIFGPEGEAVVYFKTLAEMVDKGRWLLSHEAERQRFAQSAHRLITQGGHTYADRLKTMLSLAG